MPEAPTLLAPFVLAYGGFAVLALSQQRHWDRVSPSNWPQALAPVAHRAIGFIAIGATLPLCVALEGANFGSLLWAFGVSATAAAVALTLTWAPRMLAPLAWAIGHLFHRN
ncbi:MAG: DUF3325 domain-containing protein [Burkholderiaceae bacterium]